VFEGLVSLKPPVVKEPSTKPKKKDSGWFSVYDEDAKGKYGSFSLFYNRLERIL
jgi:hypothetical protein